MKKVSAIESNGPCQKPPVYTDFPSNPAYLVLSWRDAEPSFDQIEVGIKQEWCHETSCSGLVLHGDAAAPRKSAH